MIGGELSYQRCNLLPLIWAHLNTSTKTKRIITKTKIQPTVSIERFDSDFTLRTPEFISVSFSLRSWADLADTFSSIRFAG